MRKEACFCWDSCKGCFAQGTIQTTQKSRSWVLQKIPRGQSGRSSCGTGGGPHGQSQIINLVNGVVPRPARITHATNDRVDACGAKLLNGFIKSPVAGRPTASLPVRAQFTSAARTLQALKFLPREGLPAGNWFANHALRRTRPVISETAKGSVTTRGSPAGTSQWESRN